MSIGDLVLKNATASVQSVVIAQRRASTAGGGIDQFHIGTDGIGLSDWLQMTSHMVR